MIVEEYPRIQLHKKASDIEVSKGKILPSNTNVVYRSR